MKAKPIVPGSEVEAKCGKCKDDTLHVVIAVVDDAPSRVECRACGAVHKYRAPGATAKRKTATAARRPKAIKSPDVQWREALEKGRGQPIPYSPAERFQVGMKIEHRSFGLGVVAGLSSPTACDVVFESGTIKLAMGRPS